MEIFAWNRNLHGNKWNFVIFHESIHLALL